MKLAFWIFYETSEPFLIDGIIALEQKKKKKIIKGWIFRSNILVNGLDWVGDKRQNIYKHRERLSCVAQLLERWKELYAISRWTAPRGCWEPARAPRVHRDVEKSVRTILVNVNPVWRHPPDNFRRAVTFGILIWTRLIFYNFYHVLLCLQKFGRVNYWCIYFFPI